MTNTANLKRFSDRSEQILSTITSGNRMSLDTSGSLKEHLEAITGKYSSVLTAAPENPSQGDKWFDGKSTWTYNGTAWLPEFVTPNKSYFSFAATATANTATDLTQEIEMADNDLYKVTLDLAVTDCGLSTVFVVKEDGGNGVKLWNGSSWATSGTIDVHTLSGNLNSEPVLTFVPVAKGSDETHNKFKLQITSATSLSCRGTATIDHLLSGAITDGAVYDPTSGGGGSGDGFQPDRVIVIDTTLTENIPGKAYSTFAAAKTYMEANPTLKFQVDLPAGEFIEPVVASSQWRINGNNTILSGVIDTTASISIAGSIDPTAILTLPVIQNCTINGPFKSGTSSSSFNALSILNCSCNVTSQGSLPVIVTTQKCILLGSGTQSLVYLFAMYSMLSGISCYGVNAMHCSVMGSVTAQREIALFHGYIYKEASFTTPHRVSFNHCYCQNGESATVSVSANSAVFTFSHATVQLVSRTSVDIMSSEVQIKTVDYGVDSTLSADCTSILHLNGSLNTLNCACNTLVGVTNSSITNWNQPKRYMYSTDGGTTMSDNPSGATHIGLLKDPLAIPDLANPITVNFYIWIPLS